MILNWLKQRIGITKGSRILYCVSAVALMGLSINALLFVVHVGGKKKMSYYDLDFCTEDVTSIDALFEPEPPWDHALDFGVLSDGGVKLYKNNTSGYDRLYVEVMNLPAVVPDTIVNRKSYSFRLNAVIGTFTPAYASDFIEFGFVTELFLSRYRWCCFIRFNYDYAPFSGDAVIYGLNLFDDLGGQTRGADIVFGQDNTLANIHASTITYNSIELSAHVMRRNSTNAAIKMNCLVNGAPFGVQSKIYKSQYLNNFLELGVRPYVCLNIKNGYQEDFNLWRLNLQ